MLHIDASTLEGGGQLPRLALCLSALTLTPVHLTGIRANRALPTSSKKRKTAPPKPGKDGGLKESHLAALQFLADATDAKVTGDEVGSREVVFKPRKEWCLGADMGIREAVRIELKNPGSVFLIFQALFPYVVFAKRPLVVSKRKEDGVRAEKQWFELILCGGTNVDKSMSLEYVQQVFAPVCRKIGLAEVRVECKRRGWAGAVGEIGEVKISIDVPEGERGGKGFTMDAFQIDDRGEVQKVVINVLAHSEEVRKSVIAKTKERLLASLGDDLKIEVEVDEDSHHDSRFYILLVAHTSSGWRLGRDFLGSGKKGKTEKERDVMIDRAIAQVVDDLLGEIESSACVDEHLQDQLVVFQALAKGMSVVKGRVGKGTLHTQTVRWVCEQMLMEKNVEFDEEGGCGGIGWNAEIGLIDDAVSGMKALKIEKKAGQEDNP